MREGGQVNGYKEIAYLRWQEPDMPWDKLLRLLGHWLRALGEGIGIFKTPQVL